MRVVLVGGGKVGGYVARQLVETGNSVVVVEESVAHAERLAEEVEVLVIRGDGTDPAILTEAEVARADWLLAVTGLDEVNLVACELGTTLGARRTLARLNDPRNRATFKALGIPVVAVTDLIGEVIEREIDREQLERVTLIGGGAISLIEVEIPSSCPPRRIADLDLPGQSLVVTVVDPEGLATVPGATTVIRPGDRVVAVTSLDLEPKVRDTLCGNGS
ncbi:MAG: NAD-binding protein [Acidimicrobiia bacterium]|nr:MAG: NAD-binding protein [Acidimicrobiia bacterium]